jgi:hypothetical protein
VSRSLAARILGRRPDGEGDGTESVVLSFPKSGRTWLDHLYVSYAASRCLGEGAPAFLDEAFSGKAYLTKPHRHPHFQKLLAPAAHRALVPSVRFVHGFPAAPYWELNVPVERFSGSKVVLLARDPRDVVVSYYHHMRAEAKRRIADDVSLSEFLRSESMGIRAVLAYMRQVLERAPDACRAFDVVHYEDLVADTAGAFTRFLRSVGAEDVDPTAVGRAVERATFARLQGAELAARGGKVRDDALRFRRGRPGSHRSELAPGDIAYVNAVVGAHLHPSLGRYRQAV